MERSAPYALIAAFVLVGLAVAAGLLVWLADYDPGRRTVTYAVVFEDVSGLSLASEVRYNGLPVGEVATMALDPAGTGLIRVEIEVLEDVPLRAGAVARLSTQGVTGVAVVALEGGDPRAPPLPAGDAGVPVLDTGRGAVETLADEAPALLEEARALIADLRLFATPENAGRIAGTLADVERAAAGLGEIGALVEDLAGIGRDLAPALRGLPQALARVEGAAAEAEILAATLRGTVETRGPVLAGAAEAMLTELAAAAATGRARLEETEPMVAAATEAARDGRAAIASANAALDDLGPAIGDVRAAAAALAMDLPPVLGDVRETAKAVRVISGARLPGLADRADAVLDETAALALATGEQIEVVGATARARLEQSESVLETLGDAARAVGAASGEVEAVVADIAPAAAGIADAGTRLATSADAVAARAVPAMDEAER